MHNNIFLILGYGVPEDIFQDENYKSYLYQVFNKIFDLTLKEDIQNPIIIFSGGPTDMTPPYKRAESEEMLKLFNEICNRNFLKAHTREWQLWTERNSLSTLENLINCRGILMEKELDIQSPVIFCEYTRMERVSIVSRKIFYNPSVYGIDFDTSPHRYLDPKFLEEKEESEIIHSFWAIRSADNLNKHHQIFREKIEHLRNIPKEKHGEEIQRWWEKNLQEFGV